MVTKAAERDPVGLIGGRDGATRRTLGKVQIEPRLVELGQGTAQAFRSERAGVRVAGGRRGRMAPMEAMRATHRRCSGDCAPARDASISASASRSAARA